MCPRKSCSKSSSCLRDNYIKRRNPSRFGRYKRIHCQ